VEGWQIPCNGPRRFGFTADALSFQAAVRVFETCPPPQTGDSFPRVTNVEDAGVLRRGLDQLAVLLTELRPELADRETPCSGWMVHDLVDHVVLAPERFARMVRGESIDWSAATPSAGTDPAGAFRSRADDLLRAWGDNPRPAGAPGLDWQCAEIAVHTWDLATAVGMPTDGLDAEVAERGLAFMEANLTPENRAPAFGPQQPAPEGANVYQRLAAFAGRSV
jgi:uncharacterized protein (TIGR03086 family)